MTDNLFGREMKQLLKAAATETGCSFDIDDRRVAATFPQELLDPAECILRAFGSVTH
jgi:hypothetical protein